MKPAEETNMQLIHDLDGMLNNLHNLEHHIEVLQADLLQQNEDQKSSISAQHAMSEYNSNKTDMRPENIETPHEKRRILLLEMGDGNRRFLLENLNAQEYEIFCCSGKSQLQHLLETKQRPDLALFDLNLFEVYGPEICSYIRSHYSDAELPIILLTPRDSKKSLNEAFAVGVTDCLAKPFSRDELLARFRINLRLQRCQRELNFVNTKANLVLNGVKKMSSSRNRTIIMLRATNTILQELPVSADTEVRLYMSTPQQNGFSFYRLSPRPGADEPLLLQEEDIQKWPPTYCKRIPNIDARIAQARYLSACIMYRDILMIPIRDTGRINSMIEIRRTGLPELNTELLNFVESFSQSIASILENITIQEDLEMMLRVRTEALKNVLKQMKIQKDAWNGDRFLTSLLLDSLGANRVVNQEAIQVHLYLRQKKEFQFKNGKNRIGGDINAADNLILQNQEWVVFLNGDAMGKSMQGAGGALILGTIFTAIVKRTKASATYGSLEPIQWLQDALIEFNNVFNSLDGHMSASVILGLANSVSGRAYFVNAGHPDMVLYREQKATFIKSHQARKLGDPGVSGSTTVMEFQLIPGDVMISGSDGRDDVFSFENDERYGDTRDEDSFLRHVERGGGVLEKITEDILAYSSFMDDMSLLRLSYKESEANVSKSPNE